MTKTNKTETRTPRQRKKQTDEQIETDTERLTKQTDGKVAHGNLQKHTHEL